MCAIAGVIGLSYNETILKNMEQTMLRRGPDERGINRGDGFALIHRRLTIVDPQGGKQPMSLDFGGEQYTIVYNGELYNSEEIRSELRTLDHSFISYSDTEVLLHAYAQWKEHCLEKLNGIFGFAVWEHKKRRLFLARDRMGVKPLFYSSVAGGLVFASEIKTILASGYISPKLSKEGAAQILLLGPGRMPGSGVFQDVSELKPGHYAYFSDLHLKIFQYWKLKDRIHTDSFEDTSEQVKALVTDAIRRQMVSDVPLGTFLSGGLDSSLISAVCAKDSKEALHTFSVDYLNNDQYFKAGKFQPNSDAAFIRIMRDYLQSDHHQTVLTPEDLTDVLEEATIARDLPGMADVDFSLLAFCKQIRKTVKMALSGECADEIFGGYPWYRDPEIREQSGFPWAQNTTLRHSFLSPGLREKIDGEAFVMELYTDSIRKCDILPDNAPEDRRIKEMVHLNMDWFMQTLLDRKDRMSMYCGLEVRVPFCDYRIAEYMYSVPWRYKNYENREKGLLRNAMKDYLPHDVLYRKKSPYPKTWDPKYQEIMTDRLKNILSCDDSPLFALVDKTTLTKLISSEYVWPWYGQLMQVPQTIAFFLQIEFWLRKYHVELCGAFG